MDPLPLFYFRVGEARIGALPGIGHWPVVSLKMRISCACVSMPW